MSGQQGAEQLEPDAIKRIREQSHMSQTISTPPAWHIGSQRPGTPDYRPERPPTS
jgi:hypothetical protein